MIPQRLSLTNFLSYRDATLDFRGLHTACICGANGAGKSSLLEAIAWALWGQSRAVTEDDVIHHGAAEVRVDFLFTCNRRTYRVIRSRYRGQTTLLEFQIAVAGAAAAPTGDVLSFRSLTAKGVRATQQRILEQIGLDYGTFVNSAYLRQGRADEFMLKRPGDRKQILADLLHLDQYDALAEKARDQTRQIKGQIAQLERTLAQLDDELTQADAIQQEQAALETAIAAIRAAQADEQAQLQSWQATQQQRQTLEHQCHLQQQALAHSTTELARLQQERAAVAQQQQDLAALLDQEGAIAAGYAQFQTLQTQEEALAAKFSAHQAAIAQRQQAEKDWTARMAEIERQRQQATTRLAGLVEQNADLQHTLDKAPDIEAALAELHQARQQLAHLDQLQAQVAPLQQRRQHLQAQIDRAAAQLQTRATELRHQRQQVATQHAQQPQVQQAMASVRDRLAHLEARRAYQQDVREKGLERRGFMEELQAQQRQHEAQLAAVEQKIRLIQPAAVGTDPPLPLAAEPQGEYQVLSLALETAMQAQEYPPCPLCDRPLDAHHRDVVLQKHTAQRQEILDALWVLREQLAAAEREIQLLRQEYRDLDAELASYTTVLEQRGHLQAQWQATVAAQATLDRLDREIQTLDEALAQQQYAHDLRAELAQLDATLAQLNYDDQTHALVRGDVDRWRWAEIRQAELRQAQRQREQLLAQIPQVEAERDQWAAQLLAVRSQAAAAFEELDADLGAIGYDFDQHQHLRQQLKPAQVWASHYQDLCRAQDTYPQVQQRLATLTQTLATCEQQHRDDQQALEVLQQQLAALPDSTAAIQSLEARLHAHRSHLETQLAQLGRLEQQQQHLATRRTQQTQLQQELQQAQRQQRVYHELAQAFGKNGLQTLMIENVLPQLEVETNHILSRLSANQLHVQFVTQKSSRRSRKKAPPKFIETLDILIADAHGTRPYETYSGGEAFRVNFAIRLALAKLLAQRSGTALQLLIIDEGFGTQDAAGCDRLIAAINAIAPDFACILVVTHVSHFKEAFQSRIEVVKTDQGSQLQF